MNYYGYNPSPYGPSMEDSEQRGLAGLMLRQRRMQPGGGYDSSGINPGGGPLPMTGGPGQVQGGFPTAQTGGGLPPMQVPGPKTGGGLPPMWHPNVQTGGPDMPRPMYPMAHTGGGLPPMQRPVARTGGYDAPRASGYGGYRPMDWGRMLGGRSY